jgi:hypothetical protein
VDFIPVDSTDATMLNMPEGTRLLMEIEAIEPELFMNVHPETLEVVTKAVLTRLAEN